MICDEDAAVAASPDGVVGDCVSPPLVAGGAVDTVNSSIHMVWAMGEPSPIYGASTNCAHFFVASWAVRYNTSLRLMT